MLTDKEMQICFKVEMAICFSETVNGPFALNGHMVKSAIPDGKKARHPPLGHREQRKIKLDRLEFLCVRIYYILLSSSMTDFEPCDQLVLKAH